jgi:hypothetical protein
MRSCIQQLESHGRAGWRMKAVGMAACIRLAQGSIMSWVLLIAAVTVHTLAERRQRPAVVRDVRVTSQSARFSDDVPGIALFAQALAASKPAVVIPTS